MCNIEFTITVGIEAIAFFATGRKVNRSNGSFINLYVGNCNRIIIEYPIGIYFINLLKIFLVYIYLVFYYIMKIIVAALKVINPIYKIIYSKVFVNSFNNTRVIIRVNTKFIEGITVVFNIGGIDIVVFNIMEIIVKLLFEGGNRSLR